MNDVREVAERTRGKRNWSIREVRAAMPKMSRQLVDKEFRARYGAHRRPSVANGPTGWHQPPTAMAVHWYLGGWAVCGWGLLVNAFGRPEDEDSVECPTCRRAIERSKVA